MLLVEFLVEDLASLVAEVSQAEFHILSVNRPGLYTYRGGFLPLLVDFVKTVPFLMHL
jgi:hypothetical protein